MKPYVIISLFFLACILQACQINSTAGDGQLLSDGYISFMAGTTRIIAHDSITAGDPGVALLYGSYGDSTLTIAGGGAQLSITHCHDTGTYLLSISPDSAAYASGSLFVEVRRITYSTDSVHAGVMHLTRLDTVSGRIAGTFSFTAHQYNGSATDTIQIQNGTLFDFPVTVVKN
jgi:Family of unknown function (DUF6252)